jgi:1,4-alpha-glucan branching enzyme
VLALGALLMPRTIAAPVDVASDAVETNLPSADATPALLPVVATSARPIVFELDAAQARSVQVLGDFNGWSRESARMQRGADGRWRLTTLLPPGRYVYAYLVDGTRFVSDPARDAVEDRDFGVTGSELVVGEAP